MADPVSVLIVEDDPDFRVLVETLLREAGARTRHVESGDDAVRLLADIPVDGVVTDIRLPGAIDGEGVVAACREGGRDTPVAVMSVIDGLELAVRLLRLGANDYIVKPSPVAELRARLDAFVRHVRGERELRELRTLLDTPVAEVSRRLVGVSSSWTSVLHLLPLAARGSASVLIRGESGTGKELVARAIHDLSRRLDGPFVAVDCASIPESLFENELFGHRRGAYSDAREDRPGVVQRAQGGTLFLDEIGELPVAVQAKLLRFLQTREYRRLGDDRTSTADVRIVAATHRDLRDQVARGAFREDLYYRLDVVRIELPPLRERREDVPLLAAAFLRRYAAELDSPARAFTADALEALTERAWPGNVRELENVVQRAVALASGPLLGLAEVGMHAAAAGTATPVSTAGGALAPFHEAKQRVIAEFERRYALLLLRQHEGNLSAAARAAGMDRKSLARLLERHRIKPADLR